MTFCSIKTKMTFAVFVLIVIIMSAMSVTAIVYFEKNFKQNISSEQFALLTAVTTQIDERIFDALVDLDTLADSVTPAMMAHPDQAQRVLDEWKKHQFFFDDSLLLFSRSGKLIAATPRKLNFIGHDYSFRTFFKETIETGKICISPPFDSIQRKSHPIVMFTTPVYDSGGKIIAVVGGSMELKQNHYLRSLVAHKLGQNGFLSLYDSTRTILMHSDSSRLLQQDPPAANVMVEKALNGYEGTAETTTRSGIAVLKSVKRLKSTDWVLAISYPLKDAYAPLYTARKYFLVGGIVTTLLSALFVWALMKCLTAPLLAFTRHLEQLPSIEGEQERLVPVRTKDEIGTLAQTFNRMMAEVGRSRDFYLTLFENFPHLIWRAGIDARCDYFNRTWLDFTGRSMEEEIGDGWGEGVHPDDLERRMTTYLVAFHGRKPFEMEYRLRRYDGEYRWIVDIGRPFNDMEGNFAGYIGTCYDLTDRKKVEHALLESEEHYRLLFENNPHPMWAYDLETLAFLAVNNATVLHYGYSRNEFLSMTILDIRHPDDVQALLENVPAVTEGIDEAGVWRHITKNNSIVFAEITSHTMQLRGRAAEVVLAHDVTEKMRVEREKKVLEEQLRQSQKMEAIGTLAGGIAHDFNNILTVIGSCVTLLQRNIEPENPCHRYVDRIQTSVDRASKLTQSLLAYGRKQISNPVVVDLNSIVSGTTPLLRRLIPESIEFRNRLFREKLPIMADQGQIEQILMNLVSNARDAIPGVGEIWIMTGRAEVNEAFIVTHGYGSPGSYALLTVADTGTGMDEKTSEKIFEPFFTTKEVGKGTGLGLAMVYGIVKQHNGYINCYSEPGHGTVFRAYLPLVEQEIHEPVTVTGRTGRGGNETILLVEDDDSVRELTKDVLEEYGYVVIEAIDGHDGLEKFIEYGVFVQLVILDVIMPKMSGLELYNKIHAVAPAARVLFVSGYPADVMTDNLALSEGCAILIKPTSAHELLHKVREMLDAR